MELKRSPRSIITFNLCCQNENGVIRKNFMKFVHQTLLAGLDNEKKNTFQLSIIRYFYRYFS